MIQKAKDEAVRMGLNALMKRRGYGRIDRLAIDRKERRIEFDVSLEGEDEPISVVVEGYEFDDASETPVARCQSIEISRPWMHALAQDRAVGQDVPIPPEVASALKFVL